jgi:hypothetical protein
MDPEWTIKKRLEKSYVYAGELYLKILSGKIIKLISLKTFPCSLQSYKYGRDPQTKTTTIKNVCFE